MVAAVTWREFEAAAPELARLAAARLDGRLALLGTLRRDGSPRISPVEPVLAGGRLLFGVMVRSAKARDLARDARCALHSAVSDPEGSEGELKLYGRAEEVADDAVRASRPEAWWASHPPAVARVLALHVLEAAFVSWHVERGEMAVQRWSPARGCTRATRPYP